MCRKLVHIFIIISLQKNYSSRDTISLKQTWGVTDGLLKGVEQSTPAAPSPTSTPQRPPPSNDAVRSDMLTRLDEGQEGRYHSAAPGPPPSLWVCGACVCRVLWVKNSHPALSRPVQRNDNCFLSDTFFILSSTFLYYNNLLMILLFFPVACRVVFFLFLCFAWLALSLVWWVVYLFLVTYLRKL